MPWIGTILLLALAAVDPGAAPPPSVEVCAVKVEASGTLAAGQEPQVPEELRGVRKLMPKAWTYAVYRFLGEECRKILLGEEGSFTLPDPFLLTVRRADAGDKVRLQYRLMKGKETILEAAAGLRNHESTWVGGPSTGNGTLYLLLSARW